MVPPFPANLPARIKSLHSVSYGLEFSENEAQCPHGFTVSDYERKEHRMELNILHEVAALQRLTIGQLRQRFAELFGEATPPATAPGWSNASPGVCRPWPKATCPNAPADAPPNWPTTPTCARPAPKQSHHRHAGRSARAGQRRRRLISGCRRRARSSPAPTRASTLQVQVLTEGFAYAGAVYPSLSAVAKAITGRHCNGYHFFRNTLNQQKGDR